MFKETFYNWVKNDFECSQVLRGNAQSFLARYYKEYYDMGKAYNELKRLAEGLKAGETSKELVFHKAKEMYGRSRLQILKEIPDEHKNMDFRSFNPFKGVSESDMAVGEVVELANMVLDARIDKAIKEYIYNIDHGRKTDNTLDIIDKLFEEQGKCVEFDDAGELLINKAEYFNKTDIHSKEFREESERVYKLLRDSKRDNIMIPLHKEETIGIYILGRNNISDLDRSYGVERIEDADLEEIEKLDLKRGYESNTVYYCFLDNSISVQKGQFMSGMLITVCYSLEDVIDEFDRYNIDMKDVYKDINGRVDASFISKLGEEYRQFFSGT